MEKGGIGKVGEYRSTSRHVDALRAACGQGVFSCSVFVLIL
jgi:hypothetical protein